MNNQSTLRTSHEAYGLLARYYDLQHSALIDDIPMYINLAREYKNAAGRDAVADPVTVLEIGSGTGRIMAPLVSVGIHVVGVDESEAMLAIAQERLAQLPKHDRYTLITADACKIELGRTFDMVVVALNTFLHNLTRDNQLAMLRTAYAHLRPGGSLIIDLPPNDEMANQPDDGEFEFEARIIDPIRQTEINKYVASRLFWANQSQELRYRIEETDQHKHKQATSVEFRLRHVFRHEMDLLLMLAGFEAANCRWYGNYDLDLYDTVGDHMKANARMIVIAKK
ncbi:MAG: class I SAM-dependent methyltransferase [Anaerolineae bacterium]|nr:class I SAM-dependent methyltransferase [Anaerolineae bacterium]